MIRPSLAEACTKIVATVGPACDSVEKLAELIEAGVDVFRINTAHGSREQHERTLSRIRAASARCHFAVAVLLDLAGPKIRLGQLLTEPLDCPLGTKLRFVRGEGPVSEHELTSSYERLIDELEPGDRVMLADGTVTLQVQTVTADHADCVVIGAGEIRSRQGINLPGVKLSVPSMLDQDIDNALWAAEVGIDFVSLSFVRRAEDVLALKRLLSERKSTALVIAKIEKPEALENLEEIVQATDGVMVARGDLGVEIDVAETPVAQKRIIRACRAKMKPVIVATQMLESMHHSSRPTRAEASDVANAILDGADACMLSGETAIGSYPVKAVETMNRIMIATERDMLRHARSEDLSPSRAHPITTAVTAGATEIAEAIKAKLIVIATRSGNTAWVKSQSRSRIPTIAASGSIETLRRINLLWGIKPVMASQVENPFAFRSEICQWAAQHAHVSSGDLIVFVTGTGVLENTQNLIFVHRVA